MAMRLACDTNLLSVYSGTKHAEDDRKIDMFTTGRYDDDSECNVIYRSVVNIPPQNMGVSRSFIMPC
jgi:hypothetical protein